jgi:hypothetical protein
VFAGVYGKPLRSTEVIEDEVPIPKSARVLISVLDTCAPPLKKVEIASGARLRARRSLGESHGTTMV